MKRRAIALLMAAVTGTGLLAGCGSQPAATQEETSGQTQEAQSAQEAEQGTENEESGSEAETSAGDNGEKVTIQYYSWSEGDYLQEMVNAFNASSSNVTVEMTQVSSDEYDDKLMTMLAGSNDIDVFNMRSGSLLSNLATSGNLADITQMISDSGMDLSIYGTGYAETAIDNKFYGLPYRASAYGLFYNKKMFDAKGIDYPDNLTWEEYADLAAELTEGEGNDRIYGGYIPDWNNCPYITIQRGSNLADDDLSALQEWWEMENRLYNVDNSHMSFTDMKSTGTDGINFFCTGKCYMYPGGEWSISDVLTMLKNDPAISENFELGIATVPQPEGVTDPVTIGGVSTFIGINASSKKQEAAFEFISYMAGKEAAKYIAAAGAIPAYIDDEITGVFEEAIGVSGAANILGPSKISETLFIPEYTELSTIEIEERELYLIGEQSLEDALKNFEDRRLEVMNR